MTTGPLSRRDFLRRAGMTAGVAAGVGVGFPLIHNRESRFAPAPPIRLRTWGVDRALLRNDLAIIHGEDAEAMVRAAFGALGGIETFISKGDVVLLKPNVAFDRSPRLGATTNPEILKAVARLVREAGAAEILVADNPINSPEGCFHKSGIGPAAREVGARLVLPTPDTFARIDTGGEAIGVWQAMAKPLNRADKVIGVAPLKDHNLCEASMAMKNWYGLLGGARNRFHQDIYTTVADLSGMITPTLVILDATRILMSNGPTGGSLNDVKPGDTIIASIDQVACDTIGYGLLERDYTQLAYLHKAEARGIGTTDWRSLRWVEHTV